MYLLAYLNAVVVRSLSIQSLILSTSSNSIPEPVKGKLQVVHNGVFIEEIDNWLVKLYDNKETSFSNNYDHWPLSSYCHLILAG